MEIKWCTKYYCWCDDAAEILEASEDCKFECEYCENSENINSEWQQ